MKESVEADRKKYLTAEFESKESANVWKAAYKILGQNDNKAPTQIIDGDEMIHAPTKMANAFNKIFLQKVEKIREKGAAGHAPSQEVRQDDRHQLPTRGSHRGGREGRGIRNSQTGL